MLKVNALKPEDRDKHVGLMKERFAAAYTEETTKLKAMAGQYNEKLLEFLSERLDLILGGTPVELKNFVADFRNHFPKFCTYAAKHQKGKEAKDVSHRNTFSVIESCFDYREFTKKQGDWNAYYLVEKYNLRICPYCQAHHVNYHIDRSRVGGRKKNPDFLIRPPLDHFLPESKYPYLAVSLGNLVPSCGQCNSGVKSDIDPLELELPNPLDPSTPITVNFSVQGWKPTNFGGKADEIEINLDSTDGPSVALINSFLLRPRYEWYRHEISDLFDRYAKYKEIDSTLRLHVSPDIFVLGFLEEKAPERAIGLCLKDVYNALKKY
ncbi:MAG: hypothetical protein EKK45_03930 [Curvibacter sp.]|nr:MAG: hypothetical protein EKK45_03930 [Curvibacter sp.]